MGCVCSDSQTRDTWLPPAQSHLRISCVEDLVITPSSFVHENTGDFRDVYEVTGRLLGRGNFTEVVECVHRRSGAVRAVKIIHKVGISQRILKSRSLLREVEVLKRLSHPSIVRIFEFFEDSTHYFLVMELCSGRELFDVIVTQKRLDEVKAATVMEQLMSAVAYCHSMNVVHRDLKPENLIVEEKAGNITLKLIDFDAATYFDAQKRVHGAYGTTFYMAPEVIEGSYSEKCDIWSAGVILYILLSGKPPFWGRTEAEIQSKILSGSYSLSGSEWSCTSPEARDLLGKMLTRDPRRRISAQCAYLHPWLQQKSPKCCPDSHLKAAVLQNLREFHTTNKLKAAVRTFIISQIVDSEEFLELRKMFQSLDRHGDGCVREEELIAAFAESLGRENAAREFKQILASLRLPSAGKIDYRTFLVAAADQRKLLSEEHLRAAFSLVDQREVGKISCQELRNLLSDDTWMEDEVWDTLVRELDREGKGVVSLQEFLREMSGLSTKSDVADSQRIAPSL